MPRAAGSPVHQPVADVVPRSRAQPWGGHLMLGRQRDWGGSSLHVPTLTPVFQTPTSCWAAIRRSSARSHHACAARATRARTTTTAGTAAGTPGGSSTGEPWGAGARPARVPLGPCRDSPPPNVPRSAGLSLLFRDGAESHRFAAPGAPQRRWSHSL